MSGNVGETPAAKRAYWIKRSQVRKAIASTHRLPVDRMSDAEIQWALMRRLRELEASTAQGSDVDAYVNARQAVELAEEMLLRGQQLSLWPDKTPLGGG